uniref:Uncharacterized protein n=1 Tax=Oryza glumipatula TaxID=40148 RepID=A0A0D9ZHW9_9ORYZ
MNIEPGKVQNSCHNNSQKGPNLISGDLATGGPRVAGIGGAKWRRRPGDGRTSCGGEAEDKRWGSWRASRRRGLVADRRCRGRVAGGKGVWWRGDLPEGGRGDLVRRHDAEEARRDGEVERVARRVDAEEAQCGRGCGGRGGHAR